MVTRTRLNITFIRHCLSCLLFLRSLEKCQFASHVRPSVRMYQRGSHSTDIGEIWRWSFINHCWENPNLFKIWLKYLAFYMKNKGVFRTVGSDIRSAATINTTQHFVSMATHYYLYHFWQRHMCLNRTKGKNFWSCVSMATVGTRIPRNVTLYAHCRSCSWFS